MSPAPHQQHLTGEFPVNAIDCSEVDVLVRSPAVAAGDLAVRSAAALVHGSQRVGDIRGHKLGSLAGCLKGSLAG